jgi:hypothetical protein
VHLRDDVVHQVRRRLRHPPRAARRAVPRRLPLKAATLSWPQSPQCSLRKPCGRMPHSRQASNSSFTNCGTSAPVAASVSAMNVAACCRTSRYSEVWSGR